MRGDHRQPTEQSLLLAGSLMQRVPLGLLEGRSCLPCRSGNGQLGREEQRKTLSELHACGKMTFPWWLEPGEAESSGAEALGRGAVGSPCLSPGW